MSKIGRITRPPAVAAAFLAALVWGVEAGRGDTVLLKNGIVYRGTIDHDKPVYWIYDGLKRVVIRDSKVAKIESDSSFRGLETFRIDQPLVVHGGAMPKEILSVKPGPWNDRGRRSFEYEGSRMGQKKTLEQAINELGPHMVKIRGVDGFWQSQLETNQVPREIVLAILAKVEQTDKNERIRVARFLIQAEWYAEARAELDRILKDFGGDVVLAQGVKASRASVAQLEAGQLLVNVERCRNAQQFREMTSILKTFPTADVANDTLSKVRDLLRADEDQAASDKALADDLRALADRIAKDERPSWKSPTLEVLKALKEAPDAVRDRLVAWRKAQAEGGKSAEGLMALAMSGYVLGADAAVDDLELARTFWTMRDQVHAYLSGSDETTRPEVLSKLDAVKLPADPAAPDTFRRFDTVSRLAVLMPPPLHEADDAKPGAAPKIHRVRDDSNPEPAEYAVALPPEYHPLRSYPAVIALHDGHGPKSAVAWWAAEASKRGYIVIAPEYRLPGQGDEYHYSTSEHAAVELALRDARRRYAVDSNRVFVGGQLTGANMAWDFGLAHPDLCAGVVVVSGLPFGYVNRYMPHVEKVPLYVVEGDLAPAANEVVFGQILKPLIATRAWDVTYVEYLKRGMEAFPEEAGPSFDWMDRRRREPFPKDFSVMSARDSDQRFFGVVVRDFRPGRTTAPEVVEPMGKNLNPATIKLKTSTTSNLLNVTVDGIQRLDVWVSPRLIDFKKRIEVRVNNRKPSAFRGMAKPDLGPMLEDLRLRGDRQQLYWMKVPVG